MSVKNQQEEYNVANSSTASEQNSKQYIHTESKEEVKPNENEDVYKTDEFRMYKFKVFPCSKRWYHDWTVCAFAHIGEKARRRDPKKYRYTGIACPDMKKFGSCVRGDECFFAHNVFEYWLHPSRYRSQLCNDGMQCKRKVCFFAHTLQELRTPSVQTEGVATFMEGGLEYPQLQLKDLSQQYDPLLLQQIQGTSQADDIAQKLQTLQLNKYQQQVAQQQIRDNTRKSMDSSLFDGSVGQNFPAGLRQQDILRQLNNRQSIDSNPYQYGVTPTYNQRQTNSTDLTEFYRKISGNNSGTPSNYTAPYSQQPANITNNNTLRDSNDLVHQHSGNPQSSGPDQVGQLLSGSSTSVQSVENSKELSQNYHSILSQINNSTQGDNQKQMLIFRMEENLAMAINQKLRQGSVTLANLPRELQDIYRRHSIDTTYSLLQEAAAQQNMALLNQQRKGASLDIPLALRAVYNRNPYQAPTQNFDILNQISSNNELLARQQQQQQQQQIQRQMSAQQQQQQYGVPDFDQMFKSKSVLQPEEMSSEQFPKLKIDQVSGLYHNTEGDTSSKGDESHRSQEIVNKNSNDVDNSNNSINNDNMAFLYQDPTSYNHQQSSVASRSQTYENPTPIAGDLQDLQSSLYGNQNSNNLGWLKVNQYQNDLSQNTVSSMKELNSGQFKQ